MVARAPPSSRWCRAIPNARFPIGGNHMLFGNVSSPPNAWDLDRGKRPGDFETYKEFIKLTQYFNCIHFAGGYPVEPIDIHPSVRHLDCLYEKLTLTDKVAHAYSLGAERVEDVMEMVRIAGGLTHEEFDATPRMYTNINSVSPLKHDFPMLDGAMRLARRGQPVVVTPFTLAGAMAPVTMSGAVALSLAEGLAAIALLQWIAPGCPVAIGTFTSNVDMKSGAPAFGTPEYMRATQMTGQMARYYGLPMRASGRLRGQRARRSGDVGDGQFALVGGAVGHQHRLPRRRLAGGRADRQPREIRHGLRTDPADPALFRARADRRDRGRPRHRRHRRGRRGRAFLRLRAYAGALHHGILPAVPVGLAQLRGLAAGRRRLDGGTRQPQYKRILAEFEPPPMDEAIREELAAFVARRKEEGGAPTDF
jgi:trimethylamine--corrinoid protein Co-methyltransferase